MASAGGSGPRCLRSCFDRRAVDELHHDEAFRSARDEVVDADDVGVLHGGQELAFGHRGSSGRFVAGVQKPLEHHPAIEHGVHGQVDPAQAAVGHAALDLVLVGDEIAGLERGDERIGPSAGRTESRFAARQGRRIALGVMAIRVRAEPPVGRHLRVRHDDLFRLQRRQLRHGHQPQPRCFRELDRALPVLRRDEPAPKRAELASDADRGTADGGRAPAADQARAACHHHGGTGIRRFQAAAVAEAAVNRAAAARLCTLRAVHWVAPHSSRCW